VSVSTLQGEGRPPLRDTIDPCTETFEAIIIAWDTLPSLQEETAAAGLRDCIEALSEAGVHIFVVTSRNLSDLDGPLRASDRGRGQLFLCCGDRSLALEVSGRDPTAVSQSGADPSGAQLTSGPEDRASSLTDRSNWAHFAASFLAERGITGSLILVVGHEPAELLHAVANSEPALIGTFEHAVLQSIADPDARSVDSSPLLAVLNGQLARRAARRVPQIDPDPSWVVPLPTGEAAERAKESLGTLGNGFSATRAAREEGGPGTSPSLLVAGAYTTTNDLVAGPIWTDLDLATTAPRSAERHLLDLRTGTLLRLGGDGSRLRTMRFVSLADPHAMALRAEAPLGDLETGEALRPGRDAPDFVIAKENDVFLARAGEGATVTVAAAERSGIASGLRTVERLAAWCTSPTDTASFDAARDLLSHASALGFDALLAEHREAWARRWSDARVTIEGDPASELAARFAVFHLLSAAGCSGEAAVGARGLTGQAYSGHVFWDADVFVLPALAAILPRAARAMLEYRIRRLPAARAAAAAEGHPGARFPWESAADGSDVTPREVRGNKGEVIPILTGSHELHIVADVSWAALRYASWTGDSAFIEGAGKALVVDTARYWRDRIRVDAGGRGHIDAVMGPDEYHEIVDDNAYTNLMARFNLRRGAERLRQDDPTSREALSFEALAAGLSDGWNSELGLYEQFAGYFDREPLLMADVARPPLAVDVLLGAQRVADSQLIKQADVVMAHHLIPEEMVAGSLGPCVRFYEPRTAHGSSLSPAIYASVLARAREPERALELFRLAARLDLDDLTGTTSEGLHLATMGSLWQALAAGFLGLTAESGGLAIDPCLPQAWSALALTFRFRSQRIRIRAEHDRVSINCETPLVVRIANQAPRHCDPPGITCVVPIPRGKGDQR
jgi:trehalose/maltose hydrolase-like predicted phosphorylase